MRQMRRAIKTVAPKAEEKISYRMPYWSYKGRLAYIGVFKEHTSFFWIGSAQKKRYKKELAKQKVVGSTLQVPRGAKVPVALIKRMVRDRAKANETKKKK